MGGGTDAVGFGGMEKFADRGTSGGGEAAAGIMVPADAGTTAETDAGEVEDEDEDAAAAPAGGKNLLASSMLGLTGRGGMEAICPPMCPMCPRAATTLSRYLTSRSAFSATWRVRAHKDQMQV